MTAKACVQQLASTTNHITNNIKDISINQLVVYRESVNLIGYITRRRSADSLRQDSAHGANGVPRLNLMKHNEIVLFYVLLDIFFSLMK